jgi:hypothetical protein
VKYLHYLTGNETAYEEHRRWRKGFHYSTYMKGKPLLQKSWQCRVCDWAADQFYLSLGWQAYPLYSVPHPASSFFNVLHQLQNAKVAQPILSKISNHRCNASSSLASSYQEFILQEFRKQILSKSADNKNSKNIRLRLPSEANGSIYKVNSDDSGLIYLVSDGKLRLIPSFMATKLDSAQIIPVPAEDFHQMIVAAPLPWMR